MNLQKIWDAIADFFKRNAWNIVIFLAVLVGGVVVIKLALNITRRIFNKTKLEQITVGFIMAVLKFLLYLFLMVILLSIVGVQITWIVTALSAIFLAVGLALQNTIANVANGIIIVSSKMFKKGDYISVNGAEGSITQINFLYVTLLTYDNKRVTLPNNALLNNVVTNFDGNNTRRVNFTFEVGYENDVELVKKVVIDCMKSNGLVRLDPAPFCRLNGIGEYKLQFAARCWCDREDYWTVYFDIMETVFNELKRNKITIAYKQVEVRERTDTPIYPVNGEALPARVEKKRSVRKHFDLEDADLAHIFNIKHKPKAQLQTQTQPKTKAQIKAEKKEQKRLAKVAKEAAKQATKKTAKPVPEAEDDDPVPPTAPAAPAATTEPAAVQPPKDQ